MITEQELMAVTDRKERFEISMLYMHLHGMPPYLDPLTLDDVRQIRNSVLHVTQGMDYTSMKEGSEYFNVETGDNAYKSMQELKKKQAGEMAQRQMMERMQREADEEAARAFHFSHMDTLNDADEESYLEVRFVRGVFAFLWDGDLDDEFPCNAPTHEWAKVIGNIYDNPELIKRH